VKFAVALCSQIRAAAAVTERTNLKGTGVALGKRQIFLCA